MKKIISIIALLSIVLSLSAVYAAESKDVKLQSIGSTLTFDKAPEISIVDDETILKFDGPVKMTVEGEADNGMLTQIQFSKYDAAEVEYDFTEDFLSTIVTYINKDFGETEITEGSFLLVLSTEDERGAAVLIIIGEPDVLEATTAPTKLPENSKISSWAVPEVTEAFDNGLITTAIYNNNDYQRNITRREFAHVMAEFLQRCGVSYDMYLEKVDKNAKTKFSDTDSDYVIEFVHSCGIINGISDTEFDPAGELTREQAAAMLSRTIDYLKVNLPSAEIQAFKDQAEFSDWATASIYRVAGIFDKNTGYAVMGGVGDGLFSPNTGYTVEQALIAAKRLLTATGLNNQ